MWGISNQTLFQFIRKRTCNVWHTVQVTKWENQETCSLPFKTKTKKKKEKKRKKATKSGISTLKQDFGFTTDLHTSGKSAVVIF